MPKEIRIDGVIGNAPGQINAKFVREQLPTDGSPIVVKIHSEGGSVIEGFAIYDAFAAYKGQKSVVIESSAFSIASFIVTAFDDVAITPNGYMMLHRPKVDAGGDDEEIIRRGEMVAKLRANMTEAYANRTGKSLDEITAILKDETYYNATEAVANGLVDRITAEPVTGRAFAQMDLLPHGVVAALFGADSSASREPTQENTMSDAQPVAATVAEIKAAFPKAKSDFIVSCIELSLPIAQVATAAAEESMTENEALTAKVAALETELADAKASLASAEAVETAEEPEASAEPTARATGVRPIAQATATQVTAKDRWSDAVTACAAKCNGDRAKAVKMANKANPGLRQAMVNEINS